MPRRAETDVWASVAFMLAASTATEVSRLHNTSLIRRANTILRPTASNAARHTPLSVHWVGDVVGVAVKTSAGLAMRKKRRG